MRTIVMTGGTSGIGRNAVERLVKQRDHRFLIGARSEVPTGTEGLPLDLERLASVVDFAETVDRRLGRDSIDALVLHAGMQLRSISGRTEDGFERTFAVNHLAHYLLLRLLEPRLAHGARVILTASGTHDPKEGTMIPPPRHAEAEWLAYPDLDPHLDSKPGASGGRAYAASKLCNVLTARGLAMQPIARERELSIVAFDPGPTPGTGLARGWPLAGLVWQLLGTRLGRLIPHLNSVDEAGGALAALIAGTANPPEGRFYAATRRDRLEWTDPSELAGRDDVTLQLWRDSERLVGLASRQDAAARSEVNTSPASAGFSARPPGPFASLSHRGAG